MIVLLNEVCDIWKKIHHSEYITLLLLPRLGFLCNCSKNENFGSQNSFSTLSCDSTPKYHDVSTMFKRSVFYFFRHIFFLPSPPNILYFDPAGNKPLFLHSKSFLYAVGGRISNKLGIFREFCWEFHYYLKFFAQFVDVKLLLTMLRYIQPVYEHLLLAVSPHLVFFTVPVHLKLLNICLNCRHN